MQADQTPPESAAGPDAGSDPVRGWLRGRAALVTGAGSGIGRAIALRFAAEGGRVAVNDVRPEAAEAVAKEIGTAGGAAVALPGDVSRAEVVDGLAEAVRERWQGLHVWVNNAAAPLPGPLAELSDADWKSVQAVTLDGTFYGLRAALRIMGSAGAGVVLNISSGAALGGEPGLGAYGAAKAAVVNLTRTAAVENAPLGVRVNAILPGPIETPPLLAFVEHTPGGREAWERQIPARRLGRPEEIAAVAAFLASDEASFVNGAVVVVDGAIAARTAAPRFD